MASGPMVKVMDDKDSDGFSRVESVRVGELSVRTGLTIRTLHYYEELGLVTPDRTTSGHRIYGSEQVQLLYRVQLLRALGRSLAEIAQITASPEWDPASYTRTRIAELDAHVANTLRLRDRLDAALHDPGIHDDTSALLDTLKELVMTISPVLRRIPTLVYRDVAAAREYLVRVFGFESGRLDTDDQGIAIHAEVTAGDGVIWLHRVAPEFGLESPAKLGAETAGMSVIVDDVDAHHTRAVAQGATIDYPPVDQPYGYREYAVRDLDSRLWAFMTPIQ